jgi:hypothetical protein
VIAIFWIKGLVLPFMHNYSERSLVLKRVCFVAFCTVVVLLSSNCLYAGTWTTLDYPGAYRTYVYGISGSSIVGRYEGVYGRNHGFLYDGTSWTDLTYVPGKGYLGYPRAIDGSNVLFGELFIYDGTTLTNLIDGMQRAIGYPYPPAEYESIPIFVRDIRGGNIVGRYEEVDGRNHGFLYDGTNWTTLDYPGAVWTIAYSISGSKIVGYYEDSSGTHGFLYDATNWTTLDYPGAAWTTALGIDRNCIVGSYINSSGYHGFVYDGITWTTLDPPGWGYNNVPIYALGISGNRIVVQGGFYDVHSFVYTIPEPNAEAGPDQTVYAQNDSKAKVTLDGSDSNDPDSYSLTYKWTWTIDANIYKANGVSPVIELSVGVHNITLVVNDGFSNSTDDVNIIVIAPLEGKLKITPQTINRKNNQPNIKAYIELPAANDIAANEPLILYPGDIKATAQAISKGGKGISADFNKAALMGAVGVDGDMELTVAGKLKSGQIFFAAGTVNIIH